jgi:hypothetical protein
MNVDLRIEKLEKTVRRLTVLSLSATILVLGALLVGMARPPVAEQNVWEGPQPVGAPKDGFVVVPIRGGFYQIIDRTTTRFSDIPWK